MNQQILSQDQDSNTNSIDFAKLGEYYSPINTATSDFQDQKKYLKKIAVSPPSQRECLCNHSTINKNNPKTVKSSKKKAKFFTLKDSLARRITNLSCQISRNENNLADNTTTSTLEDKENNRFVFEPETENDKITEIKELILCYLCRKKPISPKICPNCQKIVCEKCMQNWYKSNKKCFYCNKEMSIDKMISIPIIDNISNLIDKLAAKLDLCTINRSKINTCNTMKPKSKKTKLFFSKEFLKSQTSTRKHSYQAEIDNNPLKENCQVQKNDNKTDFLIADDFCKKHPNQQYSYYCTDCKTPYCKTCFVFFGSEKNNHINHKIIDYNVFKNKTQEIMKQSENMDEKIEEINTYINRCNAMKNCYEFERGIVVKYLKLLIDNYNEQVNENLKTLNDLINSYNDYLFQIKKVQNDINRYITWKLNDNDSKEKLISDIIKVNNICYFNSKEIDGYSDLSPKILFNVYQTNLEKYVVKNEKFHFKANLNGSIYHLGIIKKQSEIQIYIYYPIDENIHKKKFILPFIFLRRKNNNWESFELKESLIYRGNNYFIKRFKTNNFAPINSYLKIKGLIYESWFD